MLQGMVSGSALGRARQAEAKPLQTAARRGDVKKVLELLGTEEGRKGIDEFDSELRTPLMLAVENGRTKTVELLLRGVGGEDGDMVRADVNIESEDHKTPLLLAVEKGFATIATLLIENEADVEFVGR